MPCPGFFNYNELRFCLLPEQIAAQIGAELKRMQRRRQLQLPHASSSGSPTSSGSSSPIHIQQDSQLAQSSLSSLSFFGALSPSKRDTPLFTFKQVSLVCDRMIKEREQQIREQYDKVLSCKLSGGCVCVLITVLCGLCDCILTLSVVCSRYVGNNGLLMFLKFRSLCA